MENKLNITSKLELPYKLIDIDFRGETFILYFKSFDDEQTDYSINSGGVTGNFEIAYKCVGIDCNFECDISIGNIYDFYLELDKFYSNLNCENTKIAIDNYGSLNRSNLTFSFDKLGNCIISGFFKNKNHDYNSGISFENIEIDQSYIPKILDSINTFFNELKRIQGHDTFY